MAPTEHPNTSLNALSVPLRPRRRRLPQHSIYNPPLKRARRQTRPDGSDALFTSLAQLSDTVVALQTLRNEWPAQCETDLPRTPPILLKSQLFALVSDSGAVERDTSSLEGYRMIRLPSRDDGFVKIEEVKQRAGDEVVHKLVDDIYPRVKTTYVSREELARVYGRNVDQSVDLLIRKGFLTMFDEHTYNFSLPGMAEFQKYRQLGRKYVRRLIRSEPYKEISLSKLETRSIPGSCFTARWHVRDIVGSGDAESIQSSVGNIVRLSEAGND